MARVLVIEDCDCMRAAVVCALKQMKHQVTSLGDGREAMTVICAEVPHLILLDFRMPTKSGAEVLREIRKMFGDDGPATIMMSGTAEEEVRGATRDAPADVYLHKPFLLEELRAAVEQAQREVETCAPTRPLPLVA